MLGLILFCSGCDVAYLFHAAVGQFRLLNGSIPIHEALDNNTLTPDQEARLRLVAQIKAFGENELGLKKTQNYETVYIDSPQHPIYMVSASLKDRFCRKTWWFPVVGDMPYLGFFDLDSAKEEQEKLIRENLDVSIGVADAYSTLGWFQDPVTLNLIQGSTPDLAETILHEMTHTISKTGAFELCTNAYGTFDMVGNLHEWVADDLTAHLEEEIPIPYDHSLLGARGNGVFMGGFYSAHDEHGHGCEYVTTNHAPDYHDYSTGFRCCADLGSAAPSP